MGTSTYGTASHSLVEILGINLPLAESLLKHTDGDISRAIQYYYDNHEGKNTNAFVHSLQTNSTDLTTMTTTANDIIVVDSDDEDDSENIDKQHSCHGSSSTASLSSSSQIRKNTSIVSSSSSPSSSKGRGNRTLSKTISPTAASTTTSLISWLNFSSSSSSSLPSTVPTTNISSSTAVNIAATLAKPSLMNHTEIHTTLLPEHQRTNVLSETQSNSSSASSSSFLSTTSTNVSPSSSSTVLTLSPTYRSVDTPVWTYHPIDHACWKATTAVSSTVSAPYLHLARSYSVIEPVTGRIRIMNMLINMFRTLLALAPQDVLPALLLTCNGLAAPETLNLESSSTSSSISHFSTINQKGFDTIEEPLVLSIGGSTVVTAICDVFSVKRQTIGNLYKELGDLGDVTETFARKQRLLLPPPPLTIMNVITNLYSIATVHGQGAANHKQQICAKLLRSAREPSEIRYLVRTLVRNLRIGVNLITAITSLARAVALNERTNARYTDAASLMVDSVLTSNQRPISKKRNISKEISIEEANASYTENIPIDIQKYMDYAAEVSKRFYNACPDIPTIVRLLVYGSGIEELNNNYGPRPGIGIRPMLARITEGLDDVFEKYQGYAFAAEFKYDGQRAQIHFVRHSSSSNSNNSSNDTSESTELGSSASSSVRIFSRHLDITTNRWPDIVTTIQTIANQSRCPSKEILHHELIDTTKDDVYRLPNILGTKIHSSKVSSSFYGISKVLSSCNTTIDSFIIDCELVAVETTHSTTASSSLSSSSSSSSSSFSSSTPSTPASGSVTRILPFQILSTRARVNVNETAIDVHVCVFAFDLIYLNGVSLANVPFACRRALLHRIFPILPGKFTFAQSIDIHAPFRYDSDNVTFGNKTTGATEGDDPELVSDMEMDILRSASTIITDYRSIDTEIMQDKGSALHQFDSLYPFVRNGNPVHSRALLFTFLRLAINGNCEGLMCKLLEGNVAPGTIDKDYTISRKGVKQKESSVKTTVNSSPNKRSRNLRDTTLSTTSTGNTIDSTIEEENQSIANSIVGVSSTLVATYQPDVRSNSWLKVKRDYCEELADTIDAVPIGGWYGNGRKVGWFSPILVGVYDPETETYQSLCRIMSGINDEYYTKFTEFYSNPENQIRDIKEARKVYTTGEEPAVWFRPLKVWEIKGADLTISPVHGAGMGKLHPTKGIGLRFPRLLRERSAEDKGPEDATTADQIAEMYENQHRKLAILENRKNTNGRPSTVKGKDKEEEENNDDEGSVLSDDDDEGRRKEDTAEYRRKKKDTIENKIPIMDGYEDLFND